MRALSERLAADPPRGMVASEVEMIERLLQVYYRHIAAEDLEETSPDDLLGALVAHWRLMLQRHPDRANVRVYNPDQEQHGWRSRDTIIEVIARDMPFLVDSISAAINRQGLTIHFTLHPVFSVTRDSGGRLTGLADDSSAPEVDAVSEAVIQLHVERQPPDGCSALEQVVSQVIDDVARTTGDWLKMKNIARSIEQALAERAEAGHAEHNGEGRDFLNWIINDHFLFVASCRFGMTGDDDRLQLRYIDGSGLGLLRHGKASKAIAEDWLSGLGLNSRDFDQDLLITKANVRSTVHRSAYLDCVAVLHRDEPGEVVGLDCLIGLFASRAYSTPPRQIPLLRRKVDRVFAGAQVSPDGHSGRVVTNLLDNFPRDTLFQISAEDLLETTLGILALQERQRTRLFVVREPFNRFFTCLVYLPRERYSREIRQAIGAILVQALEGTDVLFDTYFSESILARLYYMIWVPPGKTVTFDHAGLEAQVIDAALTWKDGLRQALYDQVEELEAARYLRDYSLAFPGGYREDVHPRVAVGDIERIERVLENGQLGVHLYHSINDRDEQLHVRLYLPDEPVPLSRAIPVLENMGLRVHGERPYQVRLDRAAVWIHDFSTGMATAANAIDERVRKMFVEAFVQVWSCAVDNDGFNRLVLGASLGWREAQLFRAYASYLRQVRVSYSQAYTIDVLNQHPKVVRTLLRLFEARFGTKPGDRAAEEAHVLADFDRLLEHVDSLDEDRILRGFLNLVRSTLRTSYYQRGRDGGVPYLAFKLDPTLIDGMPLPCPMYEIFVFSAQMEGVHLRGGKVARGGLRWSDRKEDFRTEVLGLMKAQMVKNTVIVPTGSKGGFVVKNLDASDSRNAQNLKVVAAYRTLLRGMLDLTDNLCAGAVVAPPDVVRHDDDDPYLVIAADKGTATFSDIANEVAADYGFWLGDAFASGGSAGYDHKAMGITARGAWESVKRSFRELGIDTQTTDFTVVGIGDMSGDVFGNGMLLSPHIRLRAAFNHRHVFLDPEPDAAVSFEERRRLFALPRSSWSDYDSALISAGGGVFSRSVKSIELTGEVQQWLGLEVDSITPNDLISALLRAPVDLLWNGGIGTYVKASFETHAQAHDKANDNVRVDARSLRCRCVGEGGNLGFTQLARVEYALLGGQIHSDAIDNSGGVDCSDREVNIKILLDKLVADGDLTRKQRNQLLEEMTDDVARLVLADNYAQTQAISITAASGARRLYEHARFMDLLEQSGQLNRELEGLPDKKALTRRVADSQGLTKPEIAVLLANSKMNYFRAILSSDIPDDPFVQGYLLHYFPDVLARRFASEIRGHRLAREIVATRIACEIADHVGPGIGFRVREEVGSDIAGVARAYLVASRIFGTERFWGRIQALDNQVKAPIQIEMLTMVASFLEHVLTALLRRYRSHLDMTELAGRLRAGAEEICAAMPRPLAAPDKAGFEHRVRHLVSNGVPRDLAKSVSGLEPMVAAIDIVEVAHETGTDIVSTGWIHSALNHSLGLDWLREKIDGLPVQTHWHLLARTKLMAALSRHQRVLVFEIIRSRENRGSPRGIFEHWKRMNRARLDRHAHSLAEFKAGNVFDFAVVSLIVSGVGELLAERPPTA